MSMSVSIYRCSKCDFTQRSDSLWGQYDYMLRNGIRLPMESEIAWCEDCSRIVRMEDFQACIDELSKAAPQATRATSGQPVRHWWNLHLYLFPWIWKRKYQAWQYAVFRKEVALKDVEDMRQLVSARTSGKCLECGSVAASKFANGQEHVRCGGHIWREDLLRDSDGGEIWISHQDAIDLYSETGGFIRTDIYERFNGPAYLYRDALQVENARIRGISIPPSVEKFLSPYI